MAGTTRGRPSGFPAFLAALTAVDHLTDAERRAAGTVEREQQWDRHWRCLRNAQAAFHTAAAFEVRASVARHYRAPDADITTSRHEAACLVLIGAVDAYVMAPAGAKDRLKDKIKNVRHWQRACGGSDMFPIWREHRANWHQQITAEGAAMGVAIEIMETRP
jgi:hypothetical protein